MGQLHFLTIDYYRVPGAKTTLSRKQITSSVQILSQQGMLETLQPEKFLIQLSNILHDITQDPYKIK